MPYIGQKDFYPASLPPDDAGYLAVTALNGSRSHNRRLRAVFESRRQQVMTPSLQLANMFFVFGYQDADNYWLVGVDHTRTVLPTGSTWANLGVARVVAGVIQDDGLYVPVEAEWATRLTSSYELTAEFAVSGSDLEVRCRLRDALAVNLSAEVTRTVALADVPNGNTGFATYRSTVAVRGFTAGPILNGALYPSNFGDGVTAVFLRVADYAGYPCWYSADGLYVWSPHSTSFYVSSTLGLPYGALAYKNDGSPLGLYTPQGSMSIF
jgi:hypothetical protein